MFEISMRNFIVLYPINLWILIFSVYVQCYRTACKLIFFYHVNNIYNLRRELKLKNIDDDIFKTSLRVLSCWNLKIILCLDS
jgi:hypothetical protein